MKTTTIPISKFAQESGNPMVTYFNAIPSFPSNNQVSKIWFLSGDPSAYGNKEMKMSEEGYDIVRKSILNKENHCYVESVGDIAARTAIAKHFGSPHTSPNDVIIVSGANMGLLFCLQAFCEEGDNILIPEMGYPFFQDPARGLGVETRQYQLDSQMNFEIDLENLESLADDRTRFIFVINPSNPSGSVYSKEHLLKILSLADKLKIPVVCDEVYYGQCFAEQPTDPHYFVSLGDLTTKVPVVTISGLEKIFCVPGWCTSWLIMHDPKNHMSKIRQIMEKLASIYLHTTVFVQRALPELFEKLGGVKFSKSFMPFVKRHHDYLLKKFSEYDCLRAYPAQGTFYVTVQILPGRTVFQSDVAFVKKFLEEQNVNLVPLSTMGGRLEGFRMMSIATTEIYEEFFKRLWNFVQKYKVVRAVLTD